MELNELVDMTKKKFSFWMTSLKDGLLHGRRTCPNCGQDMKLYDRQNARKWTCVIMTFVEMGIPNR
jgi:ribosomal protein S27AE